MAKRSARVDISGALRKLEFAQGVIQEESLKMAEEIAEFGEKEMKSNILASGTPFSQKARQAGINQGPGRFRTGAMYNAVTSRVEAGGKIVRSAFGWLNDFQQYFIYQELGFKNKFFANYGPGGNLLTTNGRPSLKAAPFPRTTKGMFALRDARQTVLNERPRFVRKYEGIIKRRVKAASR